MALCHVPMCFITLFFLHGQAQCLEVFFSNFDAAWHTFLSNSVVALRISSRVSPWRSRRFHFKEEALTASVAVGEPVNIPADLDLDSLFVKDLRQHGTPAEDDDVNCGNTNLNEDMIVVVVIAT